MTGSSRFSSVISSKADVERRRVLVSYGAPRTRRARELRNARQPAYGVLAPHCAQGVLPGRPSWTRCKPSVQAPTRPEVDPVADDEGQPIRGKPVRSDRQGRVAAPGHRSRCHRVAFLESDSAIEWNEKRLASVRHALSRPSVSDSCGALSTHLKDSDEVTSPRPAPDWPVSTNLFLSPNGFKRP